MPFVIQASAALAAQTEANQDKLLDYPRKPGSMLGRGVVVHIQQTWDGNGPVPYGWSTYKGSSRQHPTLPQHATPLDPDAPAAMANGRRGRLNVTEQTKMAADLAASVASLPGDWGPVGAQAAKETGRT